MSSVLITAANRGLGLEFTTEYATQGWQVFAHAVDPLRPTSRAIDRDHGSHATAGIKVHGRR